MAIGFDFGTYNMVSCRRDENKSFVYKREVNAFVEIEIKNDFMFNIMKNAKLPDGSTIPIIELKDLGKAYVLGEAAVQMAYTMNTELKRPMKDGCLNPKEKHAQFIMSLMAHGMLDDLKFDKENLFYSIPANAINQETDSDYHSKILEAIFKAFKDEKGRIVNPTPINEALALVYAELANKAFTGMGVSCGAGMVNVCFAIYGAPVFQFAIVNSGDWIDKMAAKATGETPTFINQEKLKTDLTVESSSLVQRAIRVQYEIMIQKTINEIKKGIEEAGNKARTSNPIDIVVAGGTSMPNGFDQLFRTIFEQAKIPMNLGSIIRPKDPLFSVARGCLIAAEAANLG